MLPTSKSKIHTHATLLSLCFQHVKENPKYLKQFGGHMKKEENSKREKKMKLAFVFGKKMKLAFE